MVPLHGRNSTPAILFAIADGSSVALRAVEPSCRLMSRGAVGWGRGQHQVTEQSSGAFLLAFGLRLAAGTR
jgi:hypothetical protein